MINVNQRPQSPQDTACQSCGEPSTLHVSVDNRAARSVATQDAIARGDMDAAVRLMTVLDVEVHLCDECGHNMALCLVPFARAFEEQQRKAAARPKRKPRDA